MTDGGDTGTASRQGSMDLPEQIILRYWPWLVLCVLGAAVFGVLAALAGYVTWHTRSATVLVIAGLVAVGFAYLAVYTLISLRTRTVLDLSAARMVTGFRRRGEVRWSTVERLDVTHSLPGWTVRAWTGTGRTTIFVCHDTHGRRPMARTFDRPPPEAPRALQEGFSLIERFWRRATVS